MGGERTGAEAPRAPSVRRRDLLRLGPVVVVLPLLGVAGCDIRLQDDAPPIPLLQRKSIPDEAVLIAATQSTAALGQLAGRVTVPTSVVTRLAGVHRTQSEVLRGRLVAGGVPNHVIDEPPPSTGAASSTAPPISSATASSTRSPTGAATAAVSAPPPATATDLTPAETAAALAMLGALASVTTANRPVLASVAAAVAAASEQLGAAMTWPAADPLPADGAVGLLDGTRAAGYAMEVVAAQSSGEQRSRALASRAALQARENELTALAGASAPPGPLGYALPFPVVGAEAAARLATQVMTTLVAGGLGPMSTLPERSGAVGSVVRLQVAAAGLARAWGVEAAPFPGLTYP